VNFSVQQMYELVNDIESYPQFMPGCSGAELLEKGEGWLKARLDITKAGLNQSFVTRNTLRPPHAMEMALVEGPFSHFKGEWLFDELQEGACKVSFRLAFAFSNPLLGFAAGKLFEQVASEQVAALCRRAQQIYS